MTVLYCARIISDTCPLHLGEGSGKSSQNPSWNKGRAVIGSSGKVVTLLLITLCVYSSYSVIVLVRVVLRKTVVGD